MNDIISHRGPDDEGFLLIPPGRSHYTISGGKDTPPQVFEAPWKYCPKGSIEQETSPFTAALGHRRLAIVDLSPAGHQPMSDSEGLLWISFNGEIYNYQEIRNTLIDLGCQFTTKSDTEVVLLAYQTWGADCLSHFNGMFAFVIYDRIKNSFFAARDRFGVKPLYYWISKDGTLAFASEIKQFTVLPGWSPKLNAQKAYDFLNWGLLDHTKETLFEGVHQIRGGQYLEMPIAALKKAPICPVQWYLPHPRPFQGTYRDAAAKFVELLEDSIRLRLRSDVQTGSCLSGGLDSSSIVCIAHSILGDDSRFKTFSACSHHKDFDERSFIEAVTQKTGATAHYVYPDVDQLFSESASILWHQDEPYPTTSIFAQWLVFKLAKEHNVKVLLDGQGADEQLGGYHGFFGNHIYDLFTSIQWKSMLSEISAVKQKHPHLAPWSLLLNKLTPDPIRQPLRRLQGKSSTSSNWLDTKALRASKRHPFKGLADKSFLDQSKQQLLHTSLPMLLHFEDRDSMAHSIESRTPFLDYRLVEFNLGLPNEHKVSQGWTKRVMREGLKRTLPQEICWRSDKMGFATAESDWVCNARPKKFMDLLEAAIESAQGLIKSAAKTNAMDMIAKKTSYDSALWRQITFAQWLDLFHCSI